MPRRAAALLVIPLLAMGGCFGDDAPIDAVAAPAAPSLAGPSTGSPAATPGPEGDVPAGGASAPAATPPANGVDALPDPFAGLLKGSCEDGPGNEGADSHFVGEFNISGSTVSGTETWVLFTNKKWKERGGVDCRITWHVTGAKVGPRACSDCDYGLMVSAEPDVDGSGCPEGLIKKEAKRQELKYDIKAMADGTAFVYFAKSGKRLGQGYHSGDRLTYTSSHQCKWF
jgi:hypothetical protein